MSRATMTSPARSTASRTGHASKSTYHYIQLGFKHAYTLATLMAANIQAGLLRLADPCPDNDSHIAPTLAHEIQKDGSRLVSTSKLPRHKKSSPLSPKSTRIKKSSPTSPKSTGKTKPFLMSPKPNLVTKSAAKSASVSHFLNSSPLHRRWSSVGADQDNEYLRESARKSAPSILEKTYGRPSRYNPNVWVSGRSVRPLSSIPLPSPPPCPAHTEPSPAPVEIVDPVVEEARVRKEYQEKSDANRAKIFANATLVQERLAQGLPAWEPSGHSGLTPELEEFNRQQETARIIAAHKQQQAQMLQQYLAQLAFNLAESERHEALKQQKRASLARLREIGSDLAAVLAQMSDAYDAGNQVAFGRLAQLAAVEALKPAHEILLALPMERFDVFCIEWPLEKLDAIVTLLKQQESSMPAELATQLVDFVKGTVRCGELLAAALNPPAPQPSFGLWAQQSTPPAATNPVVSHNPSPAATQPYIPTTTDSKQLLLGQISIDGPTLHGLVNQAVKTVGAKNKLKSGAVTEMTVMLEGNLKTAGGAGRGWVLNADEGKGYKQDVNDLIKTIEKMVAAHQKEAKIQKLKDLAKGVRALWG